MRRDPSCERSRHVMARFVHVYGAGSRHVMARWAVGQVWRPPRARASWAAIADRDASICRPASSRASHSSCCRSCRSRRGVRPFHTALRCSQDGGSMEPPSAFHALQSGDLESDASAEAPPSGLPILPRRYRFRRREMKAVRLVFGLPSGNELTACCLLFDCLRYRHIPHYFFCMSPSDHCLCKIVHQ